MSEIGRFIGGASGRYPSHDFFEWIECSPLLIWIRINFPIAVCSYDLCWGGAGHGRHILIKNFYDLLSLCSCSMHITYHYRKFDLLTSFEWIYFTLRFEEMQRDEKSRTFIRIIKLFRCVFSFSEFNYCFGNVTLSVPWMYGKWAILCGAKSFSDRKCSCASFCYVNISYPSAGNCR